MNAMPHNSLELARREDVALSHPSVFLHATNTKSRDSPVRVAGCVALQIQPHARIIEVCLRDSRDIARGITFNSPSLRGS